MAQVPDAELLTAAMRQELPSGPTDDIDGEPPRAQNTPICTGTWPLDLDPKPPVTADPARQDAEAQLTQGDCLCIDPPSGGDAAPGVAPTLWPGQRNLANGT